MLVAKRLRESFLDDVFRAFGNAVANWNRCGHCNGETIDGQGYYGRYTHIVVASRVW